MNSEEILAIQHWQKVGPRSVLATFSIVKENANTLMIFLKTKKIVPLIRMYFPKKCSNCALLLNLSFYVPSIYVFSFSSMYEICPHVIIIG